SGSRGTEIVLARTSLSRCQRRVDAFAGSEEQDPAYGSRRAGPGLWTCRGDWEWTIRYDRIDFPSGLPPMTGFHPLVSRWFLEAIGEPTTAQRRGWEGSRSGRHTLIAAPTGSGKTLAAFLTTIDDLVREG